VQLLQAKESHYSKIAGLVSSPEELYLIYPSAKYPWDVHQLRKLAEKRPNFTVGIERGELMAFAALYNVKPNASAFIGNLIVADHFKGKGFGKALTEHMISICHLQYNAKAHLSVFSFNTKAVLMYASLGFQPYAIEERKNLKGEPVALIHMRHEEKI